MVLPFALGAGNPSGSEQFEQALEAEFAGGLNVVLDYLWGESAKTIMIAIAKGVEGTTPVRFVHVGEAGGEPTIELPGAALRSSAIVLMGSGLKSVPLSGLLQAIRQTFAAAAPARLQIATKAVPLAEIESAWESATGRPRVVFTIG